MNAFIWSSRKGKTSVRKQISLGLCLRVYVKGCGGESEFFCCCLFIYLFMVVLGLRFYARAFSSCGKRGPLFIAVRGPLTIAASLVVEHRLQTRRLSSCGSWA